ncbi:ABC transporter ATP-binding protein [Thermodesulfobacteriota bacterium B35]
MNPGSFLSGRAGTERPAVDFSAVRTLLGPIFRHHRGRLLLGFVALLVVDSLQLTIPQLLRHGIDSLTGATATPQSLLLLAGLVLLTAACIGIFRFLWRTMILGFSRHLEQHLRDRIFAHIMIMDRAFFSSWTTGNIMAHASNDLTAVQMACGMGMVAALDAVVMTVAAITLMLLIDVRLTLIALLPMPLLIVCTRLLSRQLHQRFDQVQAQFSLLTEFARTTLVSIEMVKAYTLERLQERRFDELGSRYVRSNLRVAVIQGLLFPVATLVGNIGMLLVLYFGGRLVVHGTITLGGFVAFVSYLYLLVWPMMAVGWVTNLAQRGLTSLGRIHHLLHQQPLLGDREGVPAALPPCRPRFVFDHLRFTYPGTDRPALQDISLEIGPGITGLTGPTGSGKSTLCRLLLRLYPVPDRTLFLDGHDVNTLSIAAVRGLIAYVGQEVVLFSDTVANNIAFGRPGAGQEEIEAAARAAAVHEDIMGFPDGYQTMVGERGVRLSGGQQQRIALARALLADRPVLLVDDGLSAIDVDTEQRVLAGIRAHLQGRTVLIVSHRINVLATADRIVVLEEGRIRARGSHHQLLAESGFYRAMMDRQRFDA